MTCSLSHKIDEIKAMVQKQIEEDKVRQLAIIYDNANTTKDEPHKAYEKCSDIPQEKHVLTDTYLKQESDKDYEIHNALFRKATKIEHQELIYEHEIGDEYFTEKQQQQLVLDEESLRETLEEEARAEKEWDERI
ncbi:hypothetical protein Tco_1573688, partial [Tanacetum coccineum]